MSRKMEFVFVVYGESGFWAIEVKHTAQVRNQDLRSLKTFREDYPECRTALVYRGRDRLLVNGILCVPADEFLTRLQPTGDPISG